MSRHPGLHAALLAIVAAYALGAEIVATRHGQLTTYSGGSGWKLGIELVAGLALVVAGAALWQQSPGPAAPLAVASGVAWFAWNWVGWDGGPTLVRSIAMLVAGLWLPLLVHAVLVLPKPRLRSRAARALVAAIYLETVVVSVGSAFFRDPYGDPNCWSNCTDNSFLIHPSAEVARALDWFDLRFAIAFAAAFGALTVWRVAKSSAHARRLFAPALAAGIALTSLHAAHAGVLIRTPLENPSGAAFATLFIGQSLAAVTVAFGLAWTLVPPWRSRRAVERLVVELEEMPQPGALAAALARATGDPSLRIIYRLGSADGYVDSEGQRAAPPSPSPARAVTSIVRDGQPIALLEHDPTVLGSIFVDQIGSATRLAIENERLQAETLAQLIELRDSRARIVQAGDTVRRQLERDLHDGAQQRLVALSFGLRLALAKLGPEPDDRVADPLVDAERALSEALAAVRAVANGLFPAALAGSGLASAIEELTELAAIRIDIEAIPDRRFPAPVEAAVYGVIREAVENAALHARASRVSLDVFCRADAVLVEASDDGIGGADPQRGVGLLDVADRVGALGGEITINSPAGGGTQIHAEIPCA